MILFDKKVCHTNFNKDTCSEKCKWYLWCKQIEALQQEIKDIELRLDAAMKSFDSCFIKNEQLQAQVATKDAKIEALQSDIGIVESSYANSEMNLSRMTDLYEQLQAQNGAMRQQLEIIKANIHEFPPEGMTIGKQIWIETTEKALSATPTDYHNPADVEALDKIANPIKHLQAEAEKEGYVLNSIVAVTLSNSADYLKDIAREALAKISEVMGE